MTSLELQGQRKWFAFAAVSVGVFMSTLDASIVNIGLPTIRQAFNSSFPAVQWVVMAYLLAVTSILLTVGRLGDMLGRKRIYTAGIVVFTVGSAFCGFAPTIAFLIVARALQGIGASMLMALGPAITTSAFPASERGKALGATGTVVAAGLTFGPAVGGYIIRYLGWRWMFFVNIPIGIIGIPLVYWLLHESERRREERFDIPGALFLFISLICVLLALSYGEEWGWQSRRIIMLFLGFVIFGASFLWWERRTPNPIFHLELFSNRVFTSASITAWISYVSLFAVSVFMPFYLRQVLGLSPVRAGQLLMLVPAAISLIAPVSGWLSDRIGSKIPAVLGLSIATVGLISLSGLGVREPLWDVAWRMLLTGIGSGIFQSPNSSAIMGAVPRNMLGIASGTVAMMRNLGMVSGVAIIGAVVHGQQARYLSAHGNPNEALVHGLQVGFLVAAAICALGVVIAASREKQVTSSGRAPSRPI